MGRFSIVGGAVVTAAVLTLSLVMGGGFGVSSPVVAGSGPATPPPSSPVAETPMSVTAPAASGTLSAVTEPAEDATQDGTDAPVAAPGAPASDAPTPDAPTSMSLEIPLGAAEFSGSTSPSAPWESAVKQTAPNELSPAYLSTDPDTIARVKALTAAGKSCPALGTFTISGAPSTKSAQGVAGTTSADLVSFGEQYNLIRYQNCLPPVSRIIYDSCMEARLFWMAESPSPDPLDAWGHIGSTRIDGVPSVGCDGNLAGGSANTGATVATKWWQSLSHRASLYRPANSTAGVCIALAMTHGGIDEPVTFTRAAASWRTC